MWPWIETIKNVFNNESLDEKESKLLVTMPFTTK
jgi:hypothetical protein